MALRPQADRPPLMPPIQYPPAISPADRLLASRIVLPASPVVLATVFHADHHPTVRALDAVESARRALHARNADSPLLSSLFTSVQVTPQPHIYIFRISSLLAPPASQAAFNVLVFESLTATQSISFTPNDLFPCSAFCATLHRACPSCAEPSPALSKRTHAVRESLRSVYHHFLSAVRNHVINDIVQSASSSTRMARRVAQFKDGLLVGPPISNTDWSCGWEHNVSVRPFQFCHFQAQLSWSDDAYYITFHPSLIPTPFLPLSNTLPIPAGTPITLLPFATPAYFLARYTGPTSALTLQFQDAFQGYGLGSWHRGYSACYKGAQPSSCRPGYVIAWIRVENKHGEEKGITIIYPTNLCLSIFSPIPPRVSLDYIPVLPTQLQPSPEVQPTLPNISSHSTSPSSSSSSSSSSSAPSIIPNPTYRSIILSSPTSDPSNALRSLTLSKTNSIHKVASEVGSYVDAVARERDRERERLRKEREGVINGSPKLARTFPAGPIAIPLSASTSQNPTHSLPTPNTNIPPAPPPLPHNPLMYQAQPSQSFYPSPPHTNHIPQPPPELSSPAQEIVTPGGPPTVHSLEPIPITASILNDPPKQQNSSYDPFGTIEGSWGQSSQNYLDMEMGFGMDMGFNMGDLTGGEAGRDNYNDHSGSLNFDDTITDDDFNFFDRPTQIQTGGRSMHLPHANMNPGINLPTPLFTDLGVGFGQITSAPPSAHPNQPSPWTALADHFTPRFGEHMEFPPPELAPPSPGDTVTPNSGPLTPNIHLDIERNVDFLRNHPSGASNFDAIPFSSYHRISDDKYLIGKFAMPDSVLNQNEVSSLSSPSLPKPSNGWRLRYDAVTDPRIGVVRKLIGVKRKYPHEHLLRTHPSKPSPVWVREPIDWKDATKDEEDDESEPESDEDEEVDIPETPIASRPTTPPPAYLPLGPTLVQTQFQHSQLLPLSTPLKHPGAVIVAANLGAPGVSVPTPVSPAAAMGAASEKSRSLEAAAFMVAQEVVENPLWAKAWRTSNPPNKKSSDPWLADVKAIAQLLEGIPGLEGSLDVESLFKLDDPMSSSRQLQVLDTPTITAAKGEAIIQISPTALRFWEKLGLGPRAGKKDTTAFVLYEEESVEKQSQVESWLATLATSYQGKHLGILTPGRCELCTKDGLFPLRFDASFRKTLASFVATIPVSNSSLAFYIVTPAATMTLSSPILRHVLSAVKKAIKTYSEVRILFQFIPEQMIVEGAASHDASMETLCYSTYNRILVPVDRLMSRRFFENGERIRNFLQEPAITLARPMHNKVSYILSPHASLDVADRNTFLHVGYQISPCGKWILAACMDERGEAHDLGIWLTQSPGDADGEVGGTGEFSTEAHMVSKVWGFAVQFARKADIEWRIVIARLGPIPERELDVWKCFLNSEVTHSRDLRPIHTSLVCTDVDTPWMFLTTKPSLKMAGAPTRPGSSLVSRNTSQAGFTDISSTTFALFPKTHMPISVPSASFLEIGIIAPHVIAPHVSEPASPSPNPRDVSTPPQFKTPPVNDSNSFYSAPILPSSTTTLIRVPCSPSPTSITMFHIHLFETFHSPSASHTPSSRDDRILHAQLTQNYYDLSVLSKVRWHLSANPLLPFHLGAVEVMRVALDRDRDREKIDAVSDS